MDKLDDLLEKSSLNYEKFMDASISETLCFLDNITSVNTEEEMFSYWWLESTMRDDIIEQQHDPSTLLRNYNNVEDNLICLERKIIQ